MNQLGYSCSGCVGCSACGKCNQQLAGNPPIVPGLSKDPQFQALRTAVLAQTTLAGKLGVTGAQDGYFAPGFDLSADQRRRSVLTRIALEDALAASADGEDAACVLNAALIGAIDESIGYGLLVPDGASIQDPGVCGPGMSLEEALGLLQELDAAAAQIVATGAAKAGRAHVTEYGQRLLNNFLKRFTDFANPFTNPLTGPVVVWVAVFVGGALVWRLVRS